MTFSKNEKNERKACNPIAIVKCFKRKFKQTNMPLWIKPFSTCKLLHKHERGYNAIITQRETMVGRSCHQEMFRKKEADFKVGKCTTSITQILKKENTS